MKPDSVGAREAIKGVDVVSMPSHAGPEASAKFVAAGDAESLRLEEDAARAKVEALGPVSFRATMGHGARRLLG